MKVSKSWLQTYFSEPLPETEELVRLITFGIFEVEEVVRAGDDEVLDIKVLPDRSSYALSQRGIAKEVAALLQRKLNKDPFDVSLYPFETDATLSTANHVSLEIENPALCRRAMKRLVVDIKVGPSPEWLVKKLESLGQRSINNVVDIANYVMLETGQPVHTFDYDKLEGEKKNIHIKSATAGEELVTLDGTHFVLDPSVLVIHDGYKALDIAGIKGGEETGIDQNTTRVVLSVCNFDPVSIRKTAQKLKLITDASIRFQNDPSPELTSIAMHHLSRLLHEVVGGRVAEDVIDIYPNPFMPHTTSVTLQSINDILGTSISAKEVSDILMRLGFDYKTEGETFTIHVPFERRDLNIQEDLVEEVGRVYGYENIRAVVPQKGNLAPEVHARFYYSEKIRAALVARGFSEVYTYTLCAQGEVELANPLAADKAFMRAHLEAGVRKSLALNARMAPLLGLPMIKLFELGTVFKKTGEELALCIGASNTAGKASKAEEEIKNTLAYLAEVLGVSLDAPIKNGVAEFDLGRVIDTLPVPPGYEPFLEHPKKTFAPFSSFPFMLRDVALWTTEQTDAGAVEAVLRAHAGELLLRLDLFDEFTKDGRTSYAFHLVFQSFEKTLTDGEVNAIMEQVTRALQEKGWEVR